MQERERVCVCDQRESRVTMATVSEGTATAPVAMVPSDSPTSTSTAEVPVFGAVTPRTSPTVSVVVNEPQGEEEGNNTKGEGFCEDESGCACRVSAR